MFKCTLTLSINISVPELLIIFIYRGPVLAVSSLRCGLLHISKESALIGDVSHYGFPGFTIVPDEKEKIARSLGPINKVLNYLCCLTKLVIFITISPHVLISLAYLFFNHHLHIFLTLIISHLNLFNVFSSIFLTISIIPRLYLFSNEHSYFYLPWLYPQYPTYKFSYSK